jgi:hypothetical protein
MSEIGVFTPEQARALWQDYQRRRGMPTDSNTSRGPRPMGTQPPITVILDAALDVATDSKTGATSCLATRLAYSVVDEEYSETTDQITVWNHSESDSYEVDTFGKAEWIDGHWWFFGDCGPMAAR